MEHVQGRKRRATEHESLGDQQEPEVWKRQRGHDTGGSVFVCDPFASDTDNDDDVDGNGFPPEPPRTGLAVPIALTWVMPWLSVSAMPGLRIRGVPRSAEADVAMLAASNVRVVILHYLAREIRRFGTSATAAFPALAQQRMIRIIHVPVEPGAAATLEQVHEIGVAISRTLADQGCVLLCDALGKGRATATAAALLVHLAAVSDPAVAIQRVDSACGAGAVQTMPQFNLVHAAAGEAAVANTHSG